MSKNDDFTRYPDEDIDVLGDLDGNDQDEIDLDPDDLVVDDQDWGEHLASL